MKSRVAAALALLLGLTPLSTSAQNANFNVVPQPKQVKYTKAGNFELTAKTLISYPRGDKQMRRNAEFLASYIKEATGLELYLTTSPLQRNCIRLSNALKSDNPEAYNIRVNSDIIFLDGASNAGLFYAIQTFRKSLPLGTASKITVPGTEVKDAPRFSYRGAMLDVSRHFVTKDSVLRFIDMLALHNINRFHWHLTDDQGWRIEIKKYPLLTKIGSQRKETVIGHNSGKYDGKPHGGFYTQKELKSIVKYAAERNITIIPEIDMPGHMMAALASYPELGCTGGPYDVLRIWGVSDDVLCVGNDKTLKFIEDVLTEVTKIFPSQYIHVGGDECPKVRWAKCPKCQARIKANHLEADGKHTAEERLQSYLINHAEKHLNKLGRRLIGWDETLEGGLAPNATVMSWRGEGGGIEAARQHHDVIMTPNTYVYFDYYQTDDTRNEPEAIGGYLPIERVYSYEPMPRSLNEEEQKHIIGVQANCWTEYMKNFKQVEYMMTPRMAALSEVQWCAPEQKNFDEFMQRLKRMIDIYDKEGYNYSKVIYNVKASYKSDTEKGVVYATLSTFDKCDIHYTLDGSTPTASSPLYTGPITIDKSCKLRAAAIRGSWKSAEISADFSFNKATAKSIRLLQPANSAYTFGGAPVLVDGLKGANTNYRTGHWIGFAGNDVEAVVDLGQSTEISETGIRTCVEKGDWIFDARELEVYGSEDGEKFTLLASEKYPQMTEKDPNQIYTHTLKFNPVKVRYVKVKAVSEHSMPEWHPGKGHAGFIFVDEISVN